MHLVLIETAGNQRYIFTTNKLRENVGASELTYRVGTQWVLEADDRLRNIWDDSATQFRKNLLHQESIQDSGNSIEVVVATSGKAILLVNDPEDGKRIIEAVTRKALEEAPGLDVCGAIGDSFALNEKPLGEAITEVHEKLDRIRENRPDAALRFLRLPVVMECATSGLPAAKWEKPSPAEPETALSTVTLQKRNSVTPYNQRMAQLLGEHQIDIEFAANIGVLDKYCDWLAVVHADGNGVGQIFRQFWTNSGCKDRHENGETLAAVNREFIDLYRRFSIALDVCTEAAFMGALRNLQGHADRLRSLKRMKDRHDNIVPILPIVLGGDDLTLVCDGQAALQFMRDFLREFEKQTRELKINAPGLQSELENVIPPIAQRALGAPRLSACAGIAIVKPHFPFSAAYELAEQLIRSAKITTQILRNEYPCSALDFHALYDSSGSDLDRIRGKLLVNDDTLIHGRPYVITSTTAQQDGINHHDWQKLEDKVLAIFATDDDGRRKLPNSQLHDLRSGLFLGRNSADARYCLIRNRYLDLGITAFDEAGPTLFFTETIEHRGETKQVFRTHLLDALDAANFWVEEASLQKVL